MVEELVMWQCILVAEELFMQVTRRMELRFRITVTDSRHVQEELLDNSNKKDSEKHRLKYSGAFLLPGYGT